MSTESMVTFILGRDHTAEVLCVDKFLGDDIIRTLAEQLKENHQKKKLVLRGNCIGLTGAQALADMLRDNTCLNFMSLEWNLLSSNGCTAIAKAMQDNKTLLHLDLRNNTIGDEGAIALVEAVKLNDTLKGIDLRWNQLTDRGALAFKEAMLDRRPRLAVQTKGNPLSSTAAAQMEQWLQGIDEEEVAIPEPPDTSMVNTISNAYQSAIIQKENANLREMCKKLQESCADMRRQLDASAVRVTELEQLALRHEFRAEQLAESYREALLRVSVLTEEHKSLANGWEIERAEITAELKRVIKEKESEIRILASERDSYRDRLMKSNHELDRLNEQFQEIVEQSQRDREACQAEVAAALDKASEASAAEKKLQAENTILNGKMQRAYEKATAAENQLERVRSQLETAIKTEMFNHEKEMEKLRADFTAQLNAANEKIGQMGKEIAELHGKASKLQTELTTQKIVLEQECDRLVTQAREVEKSRHEQIIAELKQRLQVFLATRSELEARCENYVREIQAMQEEHLHQTTQLQGHVAAVEAELQRIRSQCMSLKDALSASEADGRVTKNDLAEAKKSVYAAEERLSEVRQQLQGAVAERQQLKERVSTLTAQLDNANANRVREFSSMAQSVARAVEKEFESMRVNMHIKPPDDGGATTR